MLDLLRPIYEKTAAYGHFGRDEPEFSWGSAPTRPPCCVRQRASRAETLARLSRAQSHRCCSRERALVAIAVHVDGSF